MKKNLFFLALVVLSIVFTITSCVDTKKELIENDNYMKACELKDFSTAYEIVDKLKTITSEKKVDYENLHTDLRAAEYRAAKEKSEEAERYVILQEAMLVLESDGQNGLMRIIGIAKEHNAETWLYSELYDVAKKIGDENLANSFNDLIPRFSPEDLKISGPLMDYFEVEDKTIDFPSSDKMLIRIKRTKTGSPKYRRYLQIFFLDDKGNVMVEVENAGYNIWDNDQKVGDFITVTIPIGEDDRENKAQELAKCKMFRISSR